MFTLAFLTMTYDAPSSEKLWDYRLIVPMLVATFYVVPIFIMLATTAKYFARDQLAQYLAASTWIWPLTIVSLRFAVLFISAHKTA